jgi:hypothetical protein
MWEEYVPTEEEDYKAKTTCLQSTDTTDAKSPSQQPASLY